VKGEEIFFSILVLLLGMGLLYLQYTRAQIKDPEKVT